MTIASADLERVVEFVWDTLAGCRVLRTPESEAGDEAVERLASIISLEGDAGGRLTLECPLTLARRAAAHMFGEPTHLIDLDKAQDALAELTNVVAGNLKSLLSEPCRLGRPVTRLLDADEPMPCRRGPVPGLAFRAGSDSLVVCFQGRTA